MGEKEAQIFKPELRPEEMDATQDTEAVFAADEARTELVAATAQEAEEATIGTSHEDEDATEKGFLARAGEFARDHMPPKLTAGLAAAAIAVSGVVELSSSQAERAQADEGVPALSGDALEEFCAQQATAMPEVRKSVFGGKGNPSRQAALIEARVEAMPMECSDEFKREVRGRVFMRRGDKKKRVKLAEQGMWYANSAGIGTLLRAPAGHSGWPKKLLYGCTPGPRKTNVWGVVERKLVDKQSGEVESKKTSRVPIKVFGGKC